MIAPDLLVSALGCTRERAELFAQPLAGACERYKIDTPQRLAAFLAQIGHESGALRYVRELWGPTPAQQRYEGRKDLGNTELGDGARFKGRGLIQTTGRANYARLRTRLRAAGVDCPDFEAEPQALERPEWAALSAADYWDMRGINAAADAGDFERVTRLVNGGVNGLADRRARWERAKRALGAAHSAATEAITDKEGEPMLPFVAAALPSILSAVPALVELFKGDFKTSERNAKAAELVVGIAKEAVGARNEQELVETLAADPAAAATVKAAVEANWFQIAEAGGGGIAGARAADQAASANARTILDAWKSPSLIVACMLLPLVYLVVLSLIGIVGTAEWSQDVRASLAGIIVGSIIGGLIGYYYGQTTSNNRTPPPAAQ